jgi:hypothetical protein
VPGLKKWAKIRVADHLPCYFQKEKKVGFSAKKTKIPTPIAKINQMMLSVICWSPVFGIGRLSSSDHH